MRRMVSNTFTVVMQRRIKMNRFFRCLLCLVLCLALLPATGLAQQPEKPNQPQQPEKPVAPEATVVPAAPSVPKTGDDSMPMLWLMLMALAAVGLAFTSTSKKRLGSR